MFGDAVNRLAINVLRRRRVGEEASKTYVGRLDDGFIAKYLSGPAILDIGYKGYIEDVVPIVPQAIGVELDYPGYDGRTLPFPEGSQDAVFASHCLEHIPDYRNAIRDWFRVLREGGYLVIAVPHQFLYEKRLAPPSRYNADHRRFYTVASLAREVQEALAPNSYRIRHLVDNDRGFDYTLGPEQHSGGCYEIELVVEKIHPPTWRLASPGEGLDAIEAERTAAPGDGALRVLRRPTHDGAPRILVLKLDHLGDFIIGLPAMHRLREDFPDSEITLICGTWNRDFAEQIGIFDHVACYDFFPENARVWDGRPYTPVSEFEPLVAGHFDIAIDFRVPGDTRFLLVRVDAGLRCGVGSMTTAPFLDVFLPMPEAGDAAWGRSRDLEIPAAKFIARTPGTDPFQHVTDFGEPDNFVFWGPYVSLAAGEYDVTFHFHAVDLGEQAVASPIEFDIAADATRIAVATLDEAARDTLRAGRVTLRLDHVEADARLEFRTRVVGKPYAGALHFLGVTVACVGPAEPARDRPAKLHVGEQLSLLEQLVHMRAGGPDYPDLVREGAPLPADVVAALGGAAAPGGLICIAPLSNSSMRDWPLRNYVRLTQLIIDRLDAAVALVGSPEQHLALNEIFTGCGEDRRVVNLAGTTPWRALPTLFARCGLVIANNSGVAHYAAACDARLLTLFSASHVVEEWAPRGRQVTTLTYDLVCSPCHTDNLRDCPNSHACMTSITPEIAFDWVEKTLDRAALPERAV